MAHCWEEYIRKVHNAVPLDPWSSNVQLLDILIEKRSSWLPWLNSKSMVRVGSMLTIGAMDSGWKENIEEPITAGLAMMESDQHIIKLNTSSNADTAMDFLKVESRPDIQASIKSSSSLLASITGGGSSSSAQFDVKGSKTVNCTVSGVQSHRVIWDTLMKMVSKRSSSTAGDELPYYWRPDTSKPQLQWSSKRGQALWVVTEVMYANTIKTEADKQGQVGAKGNITTPTKTTVNASGKVDGSTQLDLEREEIWVVTASKEEKVFPFALRMKKLDYDAHGTLRSPLRRNNSLMVMNTATHIDKLNRSSSVSQVPSSRLFKS